MSNLDLAWNICNSNIFISYNKRLKSENEVTEVFENEWVFSHNFYFILKNNWELLLNILKLPETQLIILGLNNNTYGI